MFDTVLVANRGEIALRVIRACRELGVRSVAVFSEADRTAPHVLEADEAYLLGPPPSSESYLRADRILEVAHRSGAQAVHPGYGFLSEQAAFAAAVEAAGLTFIGPRPDTIARMGDKIQARRQMQEAGVPVVPGGLEPVATADAALAQSEAFGFPVLLKAAAGGGGKGMRIVEHPDELARAFEAATREARAAFGDGALYVERYLDRPRHIEVQLLGDAHGAVVHLWERECSVQRRHQKLVEESPSAILSPSERAAICEAAVRAARAVAYRGAGTVEFLYHGGDFFFLEMNTRLQVEHPVTEMVTGVDLVQEQLRIAAGEPLPFEQDDIELTGHAIECRVTAEDPASGFLPSTGRVEHLRLPGGPGIRWDGGVIEGSVIALHYDPLLGKLIVHAPSREGAIRRMQRALREFVLLGVETSVPLLQRLMAEADFQAGDLSIRYLDDHPELQEAEPNRALEVAAAVAAALLEEGRREARSAPARRTGGPADSTSLSRWQAVVWPGKPGP